MTIGVNDVLRFVAQFDLGGVTKAQNVYHAKLNQASAADDDDVIACAGAYVEAIMAEMEDKIHTSVELEKVDVYVLGTGWEPVGTFTGTWAGLKTGSERLPAGLALMARAYKPRNGHADRKFWFGFTEDGVENDDWFSAVITDAEAAAALWPADYGDGTVDIRPVSWNQKTQFTTEYTGVTTVASRVSYQRRRKPGVGLT